MMSATPSHTGLQDGSEKSVTGCQDNAVEGWDRLVLMANAPMVGLRRTGAGLMIGTTTDASMRALDAMPNSRHEAVRISAAGLAEGLHADLSEGLRWEETIAARLDASLSRHP
ncbi:MAG: hypothetical protein U0S49_06440 [Rhodospirillales bacterium]|nr:hypothetical protein [Rhodospirillales bacterium]